jgi:drug/metabolite transporter (DMT)-like permease
MDSHPLRHRFMLVAAALLFSTGGAAIKIATLSGWQIASARSAVAAVVLLLAIPDARRGWNWRMVPVAGAYAATLVLFVLANRLTTAANAIFLQSSSPLYLLLLGPILLHERIRRRDFVYMLIVAAGIALFFAGAESASATAPNPRLGNQLAAGTGLTYALMLAGLRWLSRGSGANAGIATVALGNVLACLCALPMALPVPGISARDVAVVLYLGIVQIGLAYVLLTRGIRYVPAFEATTLLITEPAMSPFWTWLVHGETPAAWSLAGGALILAATVVHTLRLRAES